jgi:hypothetical protein
MAEILETPEEVEDEEAVNLDEAEELTPDDPTPIEEDLDPRYRDKSVSDVAKMHQEAMNLSARQGNELGELRKTFDEYLKVNLKKEPDPEPAEDIDFFSDPEQAVARAIDSHPKIRQAEQATAQMAQINALNSLQSKHPDLKDILTDENFQTWAQGSPMRSRLFRQADQNYDSEAADEILSLWKERKQFAQQTQQVETNVRKQQAKQASTGSVRGSGEKPSRKVYRRADLIKLMKTDPDRYESMQDEILLAYKEKRVK